jgi:PhzF family phenazine biosynthesis protein
MSEIALYQLDAFTGRVFGGNPAAVCPLDRWLPDATLQAIAAENNLSETAFFVAEGSDYRLRWFTPATEVDLCGHATLATGALVLDRLSPGQGKVRFHTQSGVLEVAKDGELFVLDFPVRPAEPVPASPEVAHALGRAPRELLRAERDYLAVFGNEDEVRALTPDAVKMKALDRPGMIATAPGRKVDFVSRFFAPALGIVEDPVTGSAHCTLTPYWAKRLGKDRLEARQISARGGELSCELKGERVAIKGRVAYYLEGRIRI